MPDSLPQMQPSPDNAAGSKSVHARLIRGGSSKGLFLRRDDFGGRPADSLVLKLMGSPDRRQIDGLGGADKLTSKVAVMGASTRADCDLDYLFGQVSIERPRVDWKSNCGNISAGAALYAALDGVGRLDGDAALIALHQVNTGRRLSARVPMEEGLPRLTGDFAIGGVPGTGARIDLDFADFEGSCLGGGLLPTGSARDTFGVAGLGRVEVSIVDMANLHVFVRAEDVGLDTTADIAVLQNDAALVARLEAVRKVVAEEVALFDRSAGDDALQVSMNPLVYAVAAPRGYVSTNGSYVAAEATQLYARSLARSAFSMAYPGSGAVGTAVAAGISGTLVAEAATLPSGTDQAYAIEIGHPGGTLSVEASLAVGPESGGVRVRRATIGRTARLLMDGRAFVT